MKRLIVLSILAAAYSSAARAQAQSTVDKIVTNSCNSGIKEACDIRAEAAGIKRVIHMQELLTAVCRMGTSDYPVTDDDEKTACTVRDTLTQTIKDRGYRWDNDEQEWVAPSRRARP